VIDEINANIIGLSGGKSIKTRMLKHFSPNKTQVSDVTSFYGVALINYENILSKKSFSGDEKRELR
jgi:hypothetical protein